MIISYICNRFKLPQQVARFIIQARPFASVSFVASSVVNYLSMAFCKRFVRSK